MSTEKPDWNMVNLPGNLLDTRHDRPGPAAKMSYIICTSPRVGSYMLSDAIRQTQRAGHPLEYFHKQAINAYAKRTGHAIVHEADYMRFLCSHRADESGVFSLKAHFYQVTDMVITRSRLNDLLRKFDFCILLRRRNKIQQAISMHKAITSKNWTLTNESASNKNNAMKYNFDPVAISRLLHALLVEEQNWLDTLHIDGRHYITIFYEDLVLDLTKSLQTILKFLGLEWNDLKEIVPSTIKMGDELNEEWERRFLSKICAQ